MKKVVFIHQHFRTPEEGGGIRSYFLARSLREKGIGVLMISGTRPDSKRLSESKLGFEVLYLDIPYSQEYGFKKRIQSFFRFSWQAYLQVKNLQERPDLVYCISTPLSVAVSALLIRRRLGIPFVFEVGDLWPRVPIEMGILKNPIAIWLAKLLESSAYKNSLLISSLSSDITEAISAINPGSKTITIPNFSDLDFFKPAININMDPDRIQIGYFGTVGVANGADFLERLVKVSHKAKAAIQFAFMVTGSEAGRLEKGLKDLPNCRFIPFGSMYEMREEMKKIDAGIVSFSDYPVLGTGSPNKLFDYLAAGKIVFTNSKGWFEKEVMEAGAGFYVPYKSPLEIVKHSHYLLKNPDKAKEMKSKALDLGKRKFSKKALLERWTEELLKTKPLMD